MRGLLAVALAALVVGCAKPDVDAAPRLIADSAISLGIEYELGDLAAGPDGSWWLLDTRNRVAAQFDPDGRPRRRLGRGGEGPGEFRAPVSITVTGSGDVVVADIALRRITIFSGDVGAVNFRQYPAPHGVAAIMNRAGSDTLIMYASDWAARDLGPSLVRMLLSTGAQVDTSYVWRAAPNLGPLGDDLGWFHSTSLLASGAVVVGNSRSASLAIIQPGQQTEAWNLPPTSPPLTWTKADATARFNKISRGAPKVLYGIDVGLSAHLARTVGTRKPEFVTTRMVTIGGDNHLWCVRFDKVGFLLKRYDRQGGETGSMRLTVEPTLLRPTADGIVMVVEDEAGRVLVTRVRGPR